MVETEFKAVPVDWTQIPSLQKLNLHLETILGYYRSEEEPKILLKKRRFRLTTKDYVSHNTNVTDEIIDIYETNGFETHLILQDPFGHVGPTVACPIGFPFNLPFSSAQLKRYNRWICRVHVEIACVGESLVSVPHIEPDPMFHTFSHLWDTYIRGNIIRGKEAVKALNYLGIK